jgi:Zn-dependent membrane protease YugP
MDISAIPDIIERLTSVRIPEQYIALGGILLFAGSAFFATMFTNYAILLVIRLFRVGGERGPVGRDLAWRMLAAAGESGIVLDETVKDSTYRFQPEDMDYQPDSGRLELTEDKADGRSFASAGQIALEIGRALQYRDDFFPLRFRKLLTPAANVVGFGWFVPFLATNFLPLWFPEQFHPLFGHLGWLLSALLFGFLGMFVLLKVPIDLDAARRGVAAMRKAGVFSPGETFVIYLFLGIVLSLLVFSALLIALNFFRFTARAK